MTEKKKQIKERIRALVALLKEKKIDAYIIPTDDYHGSEYVGEYFKCREFMSGFTGSAGTLVVFATGQAGLFTDGRYFIQAEDQLKETGIDLHKTGIKNEKTLSELLSSQIKDGGTIGFDGRVMTIQAVRQIENQFQRDNKSVKFSFGEDLVNGIWKDRPELPKSKVWNLEERFAGQTYSEKIQKVREAMETEHADYLLISTLDDIAWLINIRSEDVAYNPVMLGYLMISQTECKIYSNILQREKCEPILSYFQENNIITKKYNDIYDDLENMKTGSVWMSEKTTNYALFKKSQKHRLILKNIPTNLVKAVKNQTEIENERIAHKKDAIAMIKYLYWLKHLPADSKGRLQENGEVVTEIYAAQKLDEFRKENANYIGQSFDPIVAAGEHGAIVHYSATKETDCPITIGTLVLHDTGGHYLEGTTDITRTVCLGDISAEAKKHFTLVLKGYLRLMDAQFMAGVRGENLDILAREPLWKEGLDFNHGTGHGVGYLLNVHEGPNHIRYRIPNTFDASNSAQFEPGMITSNEPGLYFEGKYGIRHESLVLCVIKKENEYGKFLGFETLTLVPFDLEAVDVSMLTQEERIILNEYHANIYNMLCDELPEKERNWLYEETRAI